jgi:hypothetical protein
MAPDPAVRTPAGVTATGFCRAISQHGKPVSIYGIGPLPVLAVAGPGRDFACTQDTGHGGNHAACDGEGHILARWPRSAVERYWQDGDCGGHGHG